MPRLVIYALSDLSSQKDYDEMKAFFAEKDTGRCVPLLVLVLSLSGTLRVGTECSP